MTFGKQHFPNGFSLFRIQASAASWIRVDFRQKSKQFS